MNNEIRRALPVAPADSDPRDGRGERREATKLLYV